MLGEIQMSKKIILHHLGLGDHIRAVDGIYEDERHEVYLYL